MEIFENLITDTSINVWTAMLKIGVSFLLGLLLGAERQMRRRDAGLRTFTLICLGSTGAMLISIWIPQIYPDFLNGDPGRIAAQVLTGIGFLGAGAIARGKGSVQGLTTAACMWVDAVIGLAVGAGLYFGAIMLTLMTLFILVSVEKIEQRLVIGGANRILVIKVKNSDPDVDGISAAIERVGMKIGSFTYSIDIESNESVINYKVTIIPKTSQKALCDALKACPDVVHINMMA